MAKKRRYWQNLTIFTFCALSLSGFGIVLRGSYQGALAYIHPARVHRSLTDTPAQFGIEYQAIQLLTEDGVKLSAWYTPAQNQAIILVAHGYGNARSAEMHALFARHGYGVLAWDARAHGESGGEASTFGYAETRDVAAALRFALRQNQIKHVRAFGLSMGAVTVIRAAAEQAQIEAVIADSAFPTLEELTDRAIPYPLLRPLICFFAEQETGVAIRSVRPIDDIRRISPRPVFLIQGAEDITVPVDSAQRLYSAANEPRTLWIGADARHVEMYTRQPAEYERRVIAFFNANLLQ